MNRRRYLRLTGTAVVTAATATAAGCRSTRESDGPDPTVLEHFHGEPVVVETDRRLRFDGPPTYRAVVEQRGHDGTVSVLLFWVPRVDARPAGRSEAELLDAGYQRVAERRFRLVEDARQEVRLEVGADGPDAGYFFRAQNLTYGVRVANEGGAGEVSATLVDTTDMSNQRVLARKTVEMAAGERRPVTFVEDAWFETFRVDVAAAETS